MERLQSCSVLAIVITEDQTGVCSYFHMDKYKLRGGVAQELHVGVSLLFDVNVC